MRSHACIANTATYCFLMFSSALWRHHCPLLLVSFGVSLLRNSPGLCAWCPVRFLQRPVLLLWSLGWPLRKPWAMCASVSIAIWFGCSTATHTRNHENRGDSGDCCSCIIAWCDIKGSERNCCNVKCRQCLGKSLAWCHVIRMLAAKDVSCCLSRPGAVCRTFCFFIQGEGWRIDRFGLLVIS